MKKQLIAGLLASAAGSSFAFAPTAALNHDPATYRNVTQKASADYKTATAKCSSMGGNDKEVCMAEAKAQRAHAEADAVAQYNNTPAGREKAQVKLADADYALAKARCEGKSGADKDTCLDNAKSVHTAALADAKAGRDIRVAATGATPADKCAQLGGSEKTACLIDSRTPVTSATGATTVTGAEIANRTENAAHSAAEKTKAAASTVAEKTKELASSAVEKTKEVASTVARKTENAAERTGDKTRETASTAANKTENAMDRTGEKTRETASTAAHRTENAMDRAGEKTRDTAATIAHKTERATDKTERVASDSAITTKVKAFMFTQPDLKSLGIHVKTEQGVVMLSGFVDSPAEANKAVEVAKSVDGVTQVRSAIKVK